MALTRAEISKRYRQRHPDYWKSNLERAKAWRTAHPGYWKDNWKKYKPAMTQARKRWEVKNPDKVWAKNKKYYESQIGRIKHRIRNAARRSQVSTLTIEVVQQVYEENIKRFGTLTCELCLTPIKFGEDSLEHFHPLSRKDEYTGYDINERSNLGVAHGTNSIEQCNLRKLNRTLGEWKRLTDVPHI
jgi:hypothetical protein